MRRRVRRAHAVHVLDLRDGRETPPDTDRRKVIILGGGPNRIGQGIEFDYCCVHAAFALREQGFETIMVNCNPETVSTDYDTSDRLYFEPLTFEDVLAICRNEARGGKLAGVIVQLGGQTPLKLAKPLVAAGIPILGTSAEAIDRAEDRALFDALLGKLGLQRPKGSIANDAAGARQIAQELGYPLLVRPSYVLGGRAMMIVHDQQELDHYVGVAVEVAMEAMRDAQAGHQKPVILLDQFLKDAIEVDVDCVADGTTVVIGGVMQHIEEAGIHSGDSACVLPPHTLPRHVVASIKEQTRMLAIELGVRGLMNVQFGVINQMTYVIEVNPRASRTSPFVSKATGVPLAKIAAKVMAGATLTELGIVDEVVPRHVCVKESVFPFSKFPGVDTILGPEMRSTGEVMGIAATFEVAFGKAITAASGPLPTSGAVVFSVRDEDKPVAIVCARKLHRMGFTLLATGGTAAAFGRAGLPCESVAEGARGLPPHRRSHPRQGRGAGHQHHHRLPGDPRFVRDPSAEPADRQALLHHHVRGPRRLRRHPGGRHVRPGGAHRGAQSAGVARQAGLGVTCRGPCPATPTPHPVPPPRQQGRSATTPPSPSPSVSPPSWGRSTSPTSSARRARPSRSCSACTASSCACGCSTRA